MGGTWRSSSARENCSWLYRRQHPVNKIKRSSKHQHISRPHQTRGGLTGLRTEVLMRPMWQRPQEQRHPDEATEPPRRRGATRHTCQQVQSCQTAPVSSLHHDKNDIRTYVPSAIEQHLLWNSGSKCQAVSGPSGQPQNLLRQPQNLSRQKKHGCTRLLIASHVEPASNQRFHETPT